MSFRSRPQSEKDLFNEILARLDDLERATVNPVQRIGDQIFYIDPITSEQFLLGPNAVFREGDEVYYIDPENGDRILLAPECPCDEVVEPPTGGSKIWTPNGLSGTTWISESGDSRNLIGQGPDSLTDAGIVYEPGAGVFGSGFALDGGSGSWDALGGNIIWTIEMSHWWTKPNGNFEHNSLKASSGTQWITFAETDWDGTNPTIFAIADNAGGGLNDWILVDSTSVGVSGYGKLFMRITQNPVTMLTEVELSVDGSAWTSQGTFTFNTPFSRTQGINLNWDVDANSSGDPTDLAPSVVHSYREEQVGSGEGPYIMTNAQVQAAGGANVADTRGPSSQVIGSINAFGGSAFNGSMNFTIGKAPLYCHWVGGIDDSTAEAIFDGADLVSPAIAVAWAEDPSFIQILTGVQPSAFNGVDSSYGSAQSNQHALVYAVADLDDFSAFDANGWPDGWYPFGTKVTD